MAGRGRALTTPAWMNSGAVPAVGSDAAPVHSGTNQSANTGSEWEQFVTPEGKVYYHNRVTGVSSWEKPEGMAACPWAEFKTPEGVPYYYNNITKQTQWEMPAEYRALKNPPAAPNAATNTAAKSETPKTTAYRPSDAVVDEDPKVKGENKKKFMEMMRERGVKVDFTWEMAMDKIIVDPRYQLLKLLADRKEAFFDFIEMLRNEEAEKMQQDQGKARDDFMELLREHTELNWQTTFRKFSQTAENDPRWTGLRSDIEKECLFEEHLLSIKRELKEKERAEKLAAQKKYREVLESSDWLDVNSQWRDVKEKLAQHDFFHKLDPFDSLKIFEDYMRFLEDKDIESDRMKQEQIKRRARKAREQFRVLLDEYHSKGKFGCRTAWQDVCEMMKDEPAYKEMLVVDGYVPRSRSTPGELYGDYIEILKEDYFPQRDILRDIQKKIGFNFRVNTTKKEFEEAFAKEEEFAKCNEDFRDMFFCEMVDNAEQQEKEDRRKKKIAIHDYNEYLDYKFYKKIGTITWEEAKEILTPHSIYKALDDEKLAEELFLEYKTSAAEKAIVSDDSDDGSKSHRHRSHRSKRSSSHKRKHKKHRRSDSSEDRRRSKHKHRSSKRRYEDSSDDEKRPSKRAKLSHTPTKEKMET